MSRDFQVTFDAADPIALSRFWAEVLHYVLQPPPGREVGPDEDPIEAWMEVLEAAGVPEDQRDAASAIIDPEGTRPRVFFQKVPEPQTAKNRVHLDVRAAVGLRGDERMAALESKCEILLALGATRVRRVEADGLVNAGHIVMQDPEGNEFCLD